MFVSQNSSSVTALLLVTSNTIWMVQDRTSGFRRRVLYVLTPKAAIQRDPFLLRKLQKDASGLVNWALDMPTEWSRIGQSVEAINELSGGGQDVSGVLEWLLAVVKYNPQSEMGKDVFEFFLFCALDPRQSGQVSFAHNPI